MIVKDFYSNAVLKKLGMAFFANACYYIAKTIPLTITYAEQLTPN